MRMLKGTSAYVTLMMNFVTVIEEISARSHRGSHFVTFHDSYVTFSKLKLKMRNAEVTPTNSSPLLLIDLLFN